MAVFDGGSITRSDLDQAVVELPAAQRQRATGEGAAEWLESLIHEMVIDRHLESETARLRGSGGGIPATASMEIQRQVISDAFSRRNLPAAEPVSDDAIRRYYDSHPENHSRPARRLVLHLFKRLVAEASVEDLKREVGTLRQRILAGEDFSALAKEHSDSESRHSGGQLGWLTRDQLPAELAEVIFSLEEGIPSDPLPTVEGVHLFQVSKAIESQTFELEEVRAAIRASLEAERSRERLQALADSLPTPEGSFVASAVELEALLKAGSPEATVLQMDDYRVTAGRLRAQLVQRARALGQPPTIDLAQSLLRGLAARERIYREALRQGLGDEPDLVARVAEVKRRERLRSLRQQALESKLSVEPERLREYYENNQLRFSSPLRVRARRALVPVTGEDANRRMAELEAVVRTSRNSSETSLRDMADRYGGEVEDLGSVTLVELAQIDPRLSALVATLQAGELSPPLQTGASLQVVQITERQEPAPMPYEASLDSVRSAYLTDHGQELYSEWSRETLESLSLVVFRERLRG